MTKKRNPRSTALVVGLVMAGLATWKWYRARELSAAILGASAAVVFLAAAVRSWASVFDRLWMKLAGILGAVNARVLLSALYFVVLTPMGGLTRLIGRDPLRRRGARENTYWIPRTTRRQTPEGFERTF